MSISNVNGEIIDADYVTMVVISIKRPKVFDYKALRDDGHWFIKIEISCCLEVEAFNSKHQIIDRYCYVVDIDLHGVSVNHSVKVTMENFHASVSVRVVKAVNDLGSENQVVVHLLGQKRREDLNHDVNVTDLRPMNIYSLLSLSFVH